MFIIFGILILIVIVIIGVFIFIKMSSPLNKYKFHKKKDSNGNDIRRVAEEHRNNYKKMAELCNAETGCVGFNTDGWLKNKIRPTDEWKTYDHWTDEDGMYVKK